MIKKSKKYKEEIKNIIENNNGIEIENKSPKKYNINLVIGVVVSLIMILLVTLLLYGSNSNNVTYDEKIFDNTFVHEIDVTISEEDYKDLLENPLEKTKYKVSITIDGEEMDNVSFATKGNSSLSQVASNKDSDRYSFKINFKKFDKNQTYYGLDKLNLNNSISDPSYMKDFISYEMFRYLGIDAPLTSYINLKINGEDKGLYVAIEEIGESYLKRLGRKNTIIYKPESDSMDMGNKDKIEFNKENGKFDGKIDDKTDDKSEQNDKKLDASRNFTNGISNDMLEKMPNLSDSDLEEIKKQFENGEFNFEDFDGKGFGNRMFGGANNSASLKYTDDNIDSYKEIFDNAETDANDNDFKRVIKALKNLSLGNVLEALNASRVIDYFVCHNFVLNYDSYIGSMLHNYYLFETDGLLEMIPWDYNLAFGNFMGGGNGSTTDLVNRGIDTPLSGSSEEERPMWSFIVNNENYLNYYHERFNDFLYYFESGEFEKEFDRVSEMIAPWVEKDPSSFYTYEEHLEGVTNLKQFILKRAESVRKQLDGLLSTKSSEQKDEDKVDASDIKTSGMGFDKAPKGMKDNDFKKFNNGNFEMGKRQR